MTTAWLNGFENGRGDRKLGLHINCAWYSVDSKDDYTREYAKGYHFGWKFPLDIITITPKDEHYVGHKFILKEETKEHFIGWSISIGRHLSVMNPEKYEPMTYPKFAWTREEK
jgi:hypothetical protein